MSSNRKSLKKQRQEQRNQALRRYHDHRKRNVIAQPGSNDFVLLLDNLKAGFNVAKIFRSAEVFGANSVYLINIGPFDPAPAKGGFRKVPARFYETFDDCYQALKPQEFKFYALTPGNGEWLQQAEITGKAAFIFGHEENGLSFSLAEYPDIHPLAIKHFGNTESLNVSVAASIVMFEYTRQKEL